MILFTDRVIKRFGNSRIVDIYFDIDKWGSPQNYKSGITLNVVLARDEYVQREYYSILDDLLKEFDDIVSDSRIEDNCIQLNVTDVFKET